MAAKIHKDPLRVTEFPRLTHLNHVVTSAQDFRYNCIAWGFEDSNRKWWPDPMGIAYWPPTAPREATLQAFEKVLTDLGFIKCQKRGPEPGVLKLALYANNGAPTHIARMLPSGNWWTSKLGDAEDIKHKLDALEGPQYGNVVGIYGRKI